MIGNFTFKLSEGYTLSNITWQIIPNIYVLVLITTAPRANSRERENQFATSSGGVPMLRVSDRHALSYCGTRIQSNNFEHINTRMQSIYISRNLRVLVCLKIHSSTLVYLRKSILRSLSCNLSRADAEAAHSNIPPHAARPYVKTL